MDFGLSDDQKLLDETLRGFLADRVPIERVRARRDAACPLDREIWRELAELGIAGILVPETRGGSGLGLLDAVVAAQALGHAVTPSPFLSSGVMAPALLSALEEETTGPWLEGIATGDLVVGVAFTERFSVREGAGVRDGGGAIHGKTLMALDACGADLVLVPVGEEDVVAIDRAGPEVETTPLVTTDRTRCTAELVFDGARPLARFEGVGPALDRALDAGRIALAADVFGACASMIEQAVAYAGDRRQFGRPIGSFQAVKHMCAEMIAELEPTRSLLWYAAHAFDTRPDEAPALAAQLLAHVSEIGREIASVATQVHGGIGWTDEQNLHFWYKRIASGRHLLGGPEALRERAAALQGLIQGFA